MATTEKTAKITKAMKFADTISILHGETPANGCSVDDCVTTLLHEIELLSKKNASDRKPTAVQVANEGIKDAIVTYLTDRPNEQFTVTDLMKNVPELADLSNQKVTSLTSQLEKAGKIVRAYEKRKAFFSAVC